MAKNTNGKASTDDPTTPNKFGVGTINYEYSDTSGLIAQTTADQGVTQTSFDNGTEDKGFADATKMFRNIPADWWDGFKYALIDDNGNFVSSITVAGQGTYTINESTGMVTFVPLKQFSGMADTIQIGIQEGYKAINGATPAPVAEYTPIVKPGNVLVRDAYGSGSVGAPVTVKPNYTQLGTNPSPIDLSTVSFLDESGAYPATPIKEKKVEGQGTWTIKEDGSFTFTPEAGFAGTPTQQPYSASNEKELVAAPANVGVVYGSLLGLPATTVDVQEKAQTSADKGPNDDGLTKEEMFPTIPTEWWNAKNDDGSNVLSFSLQGADDNGEIVVVGEGKYIIDSTTGIVTFTPEKTFTGKATPVNIQVEGIVDEYNLPVVVTGEYTPFVTKDNTILPNAFEASDTAGEAWSATPDYEDYNIDPTSALFNNGTKTLVVDGEGTWTIDETTGEFTFTPEEGYIGSPTPVAYTGVSTVTGNRAQDGQVTIKYPAPNTVPSTTVEEQGKIQTSEDNDGDQDAGLTPDQMFPTIPKDWYGEEGDIVKFYSKDENGNKVESLEVKTVDNETGKEITAGTYSIDPVTGIVTFIPNPLFLGLAPKATIIATGLSQELEIQYTPFYFPARVELPSDRYDQTVLGAVTDTSMDTSTDMIWKTKDFEINKDSIQLIPMEGIESTLSDNGKTLTVPDQGVWTVIVEGEKPAEGEDIREVKFQFTPEIGFIGQPRELNYTAKNTNGVPSAVPGQIVFTYPEATPQDAIITAKQGEVQNSSDAGDGDQGLTFDKMFPRVKEVPNSLGVAYKLAGADAEGKLVIPNQGTYEIDGDHVKFTPLPNFTGTATPATVEVHV